MRPPLPVLLVALALLLAGCSGGGHRNAVRSSTTASSTTLATEPISTVPPSTVPDCSKSGRASAGALSSAAQSASRATGDFDGDGRPDTVTAYALGDENTVKPWHLRVALASGFAGDLGLDSPRELGPQPAKVLGTTDARGDGLALAFVVVDSGASTQTIALFGWRDCAIAPVTLTAGGMAEFQLGGGVEHGDGIECATAGTQHAIVAHHAETSDGHTWHATDTTYRWQPTGLTLAVVDTARHDFTAANGDPRLDRYYQLHCGGVSA